MIRQARPTDASRLAEILIFTKRTAYRSIFQNDAVSFGVMQVLPLALAYQNEPGRLDGVFVYDDAFAKGMIALKKVPGEHDGGTLEVTELYVDPFFQREGVGSALVEHARLEAKRQNARELVLWVLEKNEAGKRFYEKRGFAFTGERELEDGTPEYLVKYRLEI